MVRSDNLKKTLETGLPPELANDLVEDFLLIRQDAATGLLGRSAPGKFVETVVQILQHLEGSQYDTQPDVDKYLRSLESRPSPLEDGLRICVNRIARAMYTLRSKRNIMHKGQVDPNHYDLAFLLHGAQWIMAELIRTTEDISMAEAGDLVAQTQAPVGGLVEDFGKRKLVLQDLSTKDEILVLLHSYYPKAVDVSTIIGSLDRRHPKTVRNALRKLWEEKLVEGTNKEGYQLTKVGFREASEVIRACIQMDKST